MSSATGGIMNIFFIAIFIILISGILAFTVNYNKAFKVKNHVINSIEQCQGLNTCAIDKIDDYMERIGYNGSSECKDGYNSVNDTNYKGYCYKYHNVSNTKEKGERGYYEISADVDMANITVPFLNDIFRRVFHVSGTTSTIRVLDTSQKEV